MRRDVAKEIPVFIKFFCEKRSDLMLREISALDCAYEGERGTNDR